MKYMIICAALLCCCLAQAQQPAAPLAFEVASIKPAAPPQQPNQIRFGMQTDGGMLRYTNVALKDMIRTAYRVKDFQIEGPDWLNSTRFDMVAKFPEGATEKQVPEMLQALLAERFKLTLHRESGEGQIYALVVDKGGPKLKPAEVQLANAPAADKNAQASDKVPLRSPDGKPPRGAFMMMMGPNGVTFKAPSATLAGLADALSRFTERPVMDMTNIQGQYDFDLSFAPETMRGAMRMAGPLPAAGADHPPADAPTERAESIFESVKHYGLKLEPRKAPIESLIIDRIEKTPTEN